jgi:hypothetical protein
MSENGPREGFRDLPRSGRETGARAVEPDSPAGLAYRALSKSLRRRRAELVALVEAGEKAENVAKSYEAAHPLEPAVTVGEVDAAVAEVRSKGRAGKVLH